MDYKKALRGLFIALAGATLTYITELLPGVDFGAYTVVVVAIASAGVNFAREWLKSQGYSV